jgi:hypothetical protein
MLEYVKAQEKNMARRKEIDWLLVEKLCEIHCKKSEICHIVDVTDDTLDAACKRDCFMPFSEFYEKHTASGKMSLRRAQLNKALSGNAAMQIWLGKQWLDQRENPMGEDGQVRTFFFNYKERE